MPRHLLQVLSRHRVFAAYLASLVWLLSAVGNFSLQNGRVNVHVALLAVLVCGVALVYVLAWGVLTRALPALRASLGGTGVSSLSSWHASLLLALVALYALVAIAHFGLLGYIPFVKALFSDSDVGVSLVRQNAYFDLPLYMRYASDYSVKAIGPALLLVTYYFRSRLFWVALVVGVVYSLGLFARILPVILFGPLLIYMLMRRRWLHLVAVLGLLSVMLVAVSSVSSVTIRESMAIALPDEAVTADTSVGESYSKARKLPTETTSDWRRTSVLYALYERALIVPGQVIDQWFFYYADPEHRERGCGYRMIAPLIGCKYVPVPTKLYVAFYKENVDQGMRGSLNAASFMTEYANFGPAGFLLSCLLGGGLFAVAMAIYRDHPLALPMNLPLIVVAMESNLMTAVNSGAGWLVMTAIFVAFFRAHRE